MAEEPDQHQSSIALATDTRKPRSGADLFDRVTPKFDTRRSTSFFFDKSLRDRRPQLIPSEDYEAISLARRHSVSRWRYA
jgi:hypothetical protein